MEDDDQGSSQLLLNDDDDDASLLYCDEDPLVSTPPPADDGGDDDHITTMPAVAAASVVGGDEEELGAAEEEAASLLEHMKDRQGCYAPSRGYLDHLLRQQQGGAAGVAAARSRGVHYIIYAFGRLGLAVATAFNAVNYLDRFLSINCHLMWEEAWMVELVSVACLSIACKLDEVNIPSLHDLQMEEVLGHWFRPATVRDMELTLLKALQWRLACVTPYSFLQLIVTTTTTAAARCTTTRLLIRSLAEPSLHIRFDPSVIAASALRCVINQEQDRRHQLLHSDIFISRLVRPRCPTDDKDAADECLRMMQAIYASSCSLDFEQQQCSPVSVITPFHTHSTTVINRSAVSRRLFDGSSTPPPPPQLQESSSTATTKDDDEDGGNNAPRN